MLDLSAESVRPNPAFFIGPSLIDVRKYYTTTALYYKNGEIYTKIRQRFLTETSRGTK